MSSHRLLQSQRIKSRRQYFWIQKAQQIFFGKALLIEWRCNPRNIQPRLGITATKRYGKAIKRNRFKRRVREVFRIYIAMKACGIDVNIKPRYRKTEEPSFQEIYQDLIDFMKK